MLLVEDILKKCVKGQQVHIITPRGISYKGEVKDTAYEFYGKLEVNELMADSDKVLCIWTN